jgi:WD40 repeat protein
VPSHRLDESGSFPKALAEFASGAIDTDGCFKIVYADDGKKLATLGRRHVWIAGAATGQEIAVVDALGPARGSETQAGQTDQTMKGHLTTVGFAPDGQTLAVGDSLGTVGVWSIPAGSLLASMGDGSAAAHDLAFSPDGATLAAAYHDGSVRLWDPPTGRLKSTLSGHPGPVRSVAFSADGRTLAVAVPDSNMVRLWHPATQQVLFTEHVPAAFVEFARDGSCLVSVGPDGTVQVFRTQNVAMDSKIDG